MKDLEKRCFNPVSVDGDGLGHSRVDSPIGNLHVTATPLGVRQLYFAAPLPNPVNLLHLWPDSARRATALPDRPDHHREFLLADNPGMACYPTPCSPREIISKVRKDLQAFFSGKSPSFSFSLDLEGTPFQLKVWKELLRIPYGTTRTYGEIARRIGHPGAARAVGMACHDNPVGIIVPCHRVIGANGRLTGYAGGLETKKKLLELEHRYHSMSLGACAV